MKKTSKMSPTSSPSITHPDTAGIDVGSEEHYVAVPEDRDQQPVRHFGCFTSDLHALADWLEQCRVKTVAMKATGVYWIALFQICRLNLQVQNRSCPSFLWAFYILSIFSVYYSVTPQPSSTERSCGQQSRFSSGKTGEANHSYFRWSLFAKGFSLQQRKWGLLFFSVV